MFFPTICDLEYAINPNLVEIVGRGNPTRQSHLYSRIAKIFVFDLASAGKREKRNICSRLTILLFAVSEEYSSGQRLGVAYLVS